MINTDKIINFCDKLVSFLILVVIFFVPLFFNPLTYLSFEIDKLVLFRVAVELIFFFYVLKIILGGKVQLFKNKLFYLSILFLFLSQLISTVFSLYAHTSFWGSYWRGLGLFSYLHVFIFVLIIFNERHNLNFKKIFYVIFFSGLISSIYAFIQISGLDFLNWRQAPGGFHNRVSSTLGQPNYLGSFLLFTIPISFYLVITARRFVFKSLLLAGGFVQFLALIMTYSRGAWLGLLGAVFIFSFFYIYARWKKIFFVCLILLALAGGGLIGFSDNNKTVVDGEITVWGRLASLADLSGGSLGMRTYYYEAAWKIIKDGPIIGHGLDSQIYNFYKHYSPNYAIYEMINLYPDRAHNEILDIIITTGIIGFLAWIFFFYNLSRSILLYLKMDKRKEEQVLVFSILFALTAVYISVMFSFFTTVSLIYFWFYAVVVLVLIDKNDEKIIYNLNLRKSIIVLFVFIFSIFIVFLVWSLNIKTLIADYYYRQSQKSLLVGDISSFLSHTDKAIKYKDTENYYRSQFVGASLSVNLPADKKLEFLRYALGILGDTNNTDRSFESKIYEAMALSKIVKIKTERGDDVKGIKEFDEANLIFLGLEKDASGFSRFFYDWGNLYFYKKDYTKALDKYYRSLISYPSLYNTNINFEHRLYLSKEIEATYLAIAEAKIALGDFNAALVVVRAGLDVNPKNIDLINRLNMLYFKLGRHAEAIKYLEHLVVIYPEISYFNEQLAEIRDMKK